MTENVQNLGIMRRIWETGCDM